MISPRPRITGHRGAPRRVLVVDDERVNCTLVRELLAPAGLEVSEAVGGQDCLERVPDLRPDLILLDLRMAPPDGFETAERLRRADPTRAVKILASSAGVLTSPEQGRLAAFCDGFLPKPLDPDALLDRIADLLGLEWTYEAEKAVSPTPAVPANLEELPAREELEALLTLVRQGDVVRLRARLREPRHPAGAHNGFLQQIEVMAASFQLGRITRTLQDALTQFDRPR